MAKPNPNKKAPLTASIAVVVSVLSMEEIKALPREVQCAKFAERDQAAQRAFSEMGKLRRAIEPQLKKGETLYGVLRKLGVKDGTISNAGYGAEAFALVEAGHLAEAEFDRLTFSECLAISRASGTKSKRKMTGEEIAILFRADEHAFRGELESIFESGVTVAEAEAQATKAAADAKAAEEARAKAEQDKQDAEAKAKQDAAVAKALAEQQKQQQAAPPPVVTPEATVEAPEPDEVPGETPAPEPAPVVAPVTPPASVAPVVAPSAPVTEPVKSNVVQMPPAAKNADDGAPDWMAAVDELFVMLSTFSQGTAIECANYLADSFEAFRAQNAARMENVA